MSPPEPAPRRKLTSTEVVYLLVDASAVGHLTVTEHSNGVRITGPDDDRGRALQVLFDAGLVASSYPGHDDYRHATEADQ
jgi:hypothetical protein